MHLTQSEGYRMAWEVTGTGGKFLIFTAVGGTGEVWAPASANQGSSGSWDAESLHGKIIVVSRTRIDFVSRPNPVQS